MRPTRLVPVLAALLLSACSGTPLHNPLDPQTPASTVARITDHHDMSGNWLGRQLLAKTPSTLTVQAAAPVTADTDGAIAQYEALIDLTDDPRLQAEAMQRAAELRLQRADAGEGHADDVERAIALCTRLLAEHPDHPRRDRALYQLARAQQLSGNETATATLLRQLGTEHPDSPRAADAQFRAAELLYQTHDYVAAAATYKAVLDSEGAGAYFEPAQYKYAWALYQNGDYAPALDVLMLVLDRDLPRGLPDEPEAALSAVAADRADRTSDALRLAGLCFTALGGGRAVGEALARVPVAQRLDVVLHAALAQQLLQRRRYVDAAATYAAFIERQPQHPRAPDFQAHIVAIYEQAGFTEPMLAAKRDYAERYASDAPYWQERKPDVAAVATLRVYLDDLARQARAEAQSVAGDAAREGNLRAAHWFARLLQLYPDDPKRAETRLLYADALLDGDQVDEALTQYREVAFGADATGFAGAADAAHAAVLASRRLVDEATPQQRPARLRGAVDTGLQLAERYPEHPQRLGVLAATAADLLELGDQDRAIAVAQQVLDADVAPDLARIAVGVIADAHFASGDFAGAERAYAALLPLLPDDLPAAQRAASVERLAVAIYRQGEAARSAGRQADAATHFLRVSRLAPTASIVTSAEYDAAAALIAAEDWTAAARTLERFRAHYPEHQLIAEVDRKLALAYDHAADPASAAAVYARIAARGDEPDADRRVAAWRAGERYDQAKLNADSIRAWERYVSLFPQPLEPAVEARQRLVELEDGHDRAAHLRWLQAIVDAERGAGARDTPRVRALAAQAQLRIGHLAADDAARFALTLPIERSLPRRVAATRAAVEALGAAAAYGFAETTTQATYELANVYRDLGRALLAAPRPRKLDALALEQYELLLEEQAYPFEEQAIQAHEANLARVEQGIWNEWVRRSVAALQEMAPAHYGKHEHHEVSYDSPT